MIANAAPNAAPCEIPSVKGEPSGLRNTFCITVPETASPAPAMTAASILGKRILKATSVFILALPFKIKFKIFFNESAFRTSSIEIERGPKQIAKREKTTIRMISSKPKYAFLFV